MNTRIFYIIYKFKLEGKKKIEEPTITTHPCVSKSKIVS